METIDLIRQIIVRKAEAHRWPLNTNIIELQQHSDKSMQQLRDDLNKLYKDGKIATQNGINYQLIYLNNGNEN